MEPRIQYATADDGVRIAYWTLGEGGTPLLLLPPLAFSNISLEWDMPEWRGWYERLARRRMIVRFDWRNNGMSERGVQHISLDAFVSDIDAVVDALSVGRLNLMACFPPTALAISWAAAHLDSIGRLVLWAPRVHRRDVAEGERSKAVISLVERDWELATETFAHQQVGWSKGRQAHEWAKFIMQSITQADFLRFWAQAGNWDTSALLPQIWTPTLLLQLPPPWDFDEHTRIYASAMPNAQLVRLRVASAAPPEHEEGTRLIEEFLAPGEETGEREVLPSGTATILFTDIVDSTALTERLGDSAFRAKARELDGALRSVIREHAGTAIEGKLLGDGVLAVFTSARQGIEAALACSSAGGDAGLPLHLGLHAGDVIREEGNVYGGAVNIASRISGLSAPGEVLVSDIVRGLARTSADVRFEDRGEQSLRGVGEPVRVWAVVEGEAR